MAYTSLLIAEAGLFSQSITSELRHAVIVGESFTGAGKSPLRDHAHKVLLPNGRKGNSWVARLMPCVGKCLIEVIVGSVLLDVLSVKAITGLSIFMWSVILMTPYYAPLRCVIACMGHLIGWIEIGEYLCVHRMIDTCIEYSMHAYDNLL